MPAATGPTVACDAEGPPDDGREGTPRTLTPGNSALWADRDRTVVLYHCPPSVTSDQLLKLFPSAEEVILLPPPRHLGRGRTLHYRVVFPTVAEAAELAAWGNLELAGEPVLVVLATDVDSAEPKAKPREAPPPAPEAGVVAKAGADAAAAAGALPKAHEPKGAKDKPKLRQPERSASPSKLKPRVSSSVPADYDKIVAAPASPKAVVQGGKDHADNRTVILSGCPAGTTEDDVCALFPNVVSLKALLKYPGGPPSGRYILHFPTAAEAQAAAVGQGILLQGQPASAEMIAAPAIYEKERKGRTVVISGIPSSTTEEELHAQFPNVEAIHLPRARTATEPRRCLLTFPTVAEAEAVARLKALPVKGTVVRQMMAAKPKGTRPYRSQSSVSSESGGKEGPTKIKHVEEVSTGQAAAGAASGGGGGTRTVLLAGCPQSAVESELRTLFPTAEALTMIPRWSGGPFSGTCLLHFPTAAEAEAAAGRLGLKVKGQPVFTALAGAAEDKVQVEVIRSPAALTSGTPEVGPGDSSASPEDATGGEGPVTDDVTGQEGTRAATPQQELEVPLKRPAWAPLKPTQGATAAVEGSSATKQVLVSGCPAATTKADLRVHFPNATAIRMLRKWSGGPFSGYCFLCFPTEAEAEAAASLKVLTMMGQDVQLSLVDTDKYNAERENRTVVLSRCPPAITPEDVAALFPTADAIVLFHRGAKGQFSRCFVGFPTAAEAQEAASRPGLTLQGQAVVAYIKANEKAVLEDRKSRTVVLSGCPASTTRSELWAQFPTAEALWPPPNRRMGSSGGCFFLTFPSVAEAEAVARQEVLIVKGTAVQKNMQRETEVLEDQPNMKDAGAPTGLLRDDSTRGNGPADEDEAEAVVEEDEEEQTEENGNRTVVLSACPPSTTVGDIRALFPTARRIELPAKWSGGPFSGRCLVHFPTTAQARLAAQTGLTLQGHPVLAQLYADRVVYENEKVTRTVVLFGCPARTTEDDLHALFPNVEFIALLSKFPGGPFSGRCFLRFPTVAEAEAVAKRQGLLLHGRQISAEMFPDRAVYEKEKTTRTVVLLGCPARTTEDDLHALFPNVEFIALLSKYPG
eukprot:EG_transcript_1324